MMRDVVCACLGGGGAQAVVGDQQNETHLQRWVSEARAAGLADGWDVIVDDGGHTNGQIMTSMRVLWQRALRPCGLYVIEDMDVARSAMLHFKYLPFSAPDFVGGLADALVVGGGDGAQLGPAAFRAAQFAPGAAFVLCQRTACAIGKSCAAAPRS
jgi:hypothetical protein